MRKRVKATSIIGAALFFTGLAVIVVVAMMILVPPKAPEGYLVEAAHMAEPPLTSKHETAHLQNEILEGEAVIAEGQESESRAAAIQKAPGRQLPDSDGIDMSQQEGVSPAQRQSDLFANASSDAVIGAAPAPGAARCSTGSRCSGSRGLTV